MRETILMDADWMFHEGDIEYPVPRFKGAMYIQAKTERFRTGPASRYYVVYQGAGIYRHVWLVKTATVSVDRYGLYVKPVRENGQWKLTLENTIRNDEYSTQNVTVINEILDGDQIVFTLTENTKLQARKIHTISTAGSIENPHLWSLEDPYQYTARTRILSDGQEIDRYETKFGFRYYEFTPEKGLQLNGKKIFINGLCAHADFGLTGKAVPDNMQKPMAYAAQY